MNRQLKSLLLFCFLLGTLTPTLRADPTLQFGAPYLIDGGLTRPFGLAVDDTHDRLLIADTGNQRFKWIPISAATGTPVFTEGGFVSNRASPSALNDPQAIAADAAGNLYVVNTPQGHVKLYTWNGGAYALNASFTSASSHTVAGVGISFPRDIAVGPDGAVYLLDSGNNRILKASGPAATSWSVFKQDNGWKNPYGLAVDSNNVVYVADTGNHRIVKIPVAGPSVTFGHWGTNSGEFRYPRDVAVDRYGRIFVADTFNHRIQILDPDGHALASIGHAPAIHTIDKVVVDARDRLWAIDSDASQVIAFLGGAVPPAFDAYLRDYVGDGGLEPSASSYALESPDILVRYQPDVSLATAAAMGLPYYGFQEPRAGVNNYIYIAVHNRGTQPAPDNFVKLFAYDPYSGQHFPADWKAEGFYEAYSSTSHFQTGNTLAVPSVPPGGVTVVGPLVWRAPQPQSTLAGDGRLKLAARLSNPYDFPPTGPSTTMPRDSNNVAERPVKIQPAPFTTGQQNTLVVRVNFPDVSTTSDPDVVAARIGEMAEWVRQASWGEATVEVVNRGPITLPHTSAYYRALSRHPLVDIPHDALAALLSAEPGLLDGSPTAEPIGRVIIVTNDLNAGTDWATTGPWPYTVNLVTRYLSVSIQGGGNPTPQFSHGMGHQLGMVDLYPYDHVTLSRPFADGWDNMAQPMNGAHPLVWSKEIPFWASAHNARILYVPRPAGGVLWNNDGHGIPLHYQETASSGQIVGVAFGLTNGITAYSEENAFYYVEARKNSGDGAGSDAVLPQTGVLMYYANNLIPQGQGPVILRDHVPGGTLDDAAIPIGSSEAPNGTGLSVAVDSGTGGSDYTLNVTWTPPITDYDVYMHPGPAVWASPDIWVDNQSNGYDEDNNRPPEDRGDKAIAGEENRVYARVFNSGPADAYDVEVVVSFSQPYHTIHGAGAFTIYRSVFIDHIPAGQSRTAYVTWIPMTGIEPHTCARVELRRLFDDTNAANNSAQRNLQVDHSVHGSPYTPFDFPFQVANTTSTPRLILFRADGVPKGWTWSITPERALVDPHSLAAGILHIQPSPSTPDCSSRSIDLTSWEPRGDTLVRQGGATLEVDLQRKVLLKGGLKVSGCSLNDLIKLGYIPPKRGAAAGNPIPECRLIQTPVCSQPPLPFVPMTVRYKDPSGLPHYQTTMTDGRGCITDSKVVTTGGDWPVQVQFDGNLCMGPALWISTATIPLTPVDPVDPDEPGGDRVYCLTGLSKDLNGTLSGRQSERLVNRLCPVTESASESMLLNVSTSGALSSAEADALKDQLKLTNLREVTDGKAGLTRGLFEWKTGAMSAIGHLSGLTGVGTHRAPVTPQGHEGLTPRHDELLLSGTVISGAMAGRRIRANLSLDWEAPSSTPVITNRAGLKVAGTLEGLIEKECQLTSAQIGARIKKAVANQKPMGPCGTLPCLTRGSWSGAGVTTLMQTEEDHCGGPAAGALASNPKVCVTTKTWDHADLNLTQDPGGQLGHGKLQLNNVLQVSGFQGRGEHAGTFILTGAGGLRIEGQALGLTRAGTHRKPTGRAYESFDAVGHLEGRLTGAVTAGKLKGSTFEARYAMHIPDQAGRRRAVTLTLDGFVVKGCLEAPAILSAPPIVPPPPPVPPREPSIDTGGLGLRPISELPPAAVQAYIRARGGRRTPAIELSLRIADHQFRALDKSGSGALTPSDFAAHAPSPADRKALVDSTFKRYDANHDDALTQAEAPLLWKKYGALDTGHTGRITRAQFMAHSDDQAHREFTAADRNHDGRIDFAEYAVWTTTLPSARRKK